jgi:hypothetical protein
MYSLKLEKGETKHRILDEEKGIDGEERLAMPLKEMRAAGHTCGLDCLSHVSAKHLLIGTSWLSSYF